ncbi:uncharacterized protein LOC107633299 [Arachis ipaensis]|uniref:uncharacterized protein LOC107633299 n=1 Tax=Arachis ipaensis TaxID=130454 RepID=UPI0007AFC785|nr:uncharacterized protein LOC107633299 [Arachis ipaensis]XP_025640439.1 uncharacterized protein LOC112735086 [Arachis hypogaea]
MAPYEALYGRKCQSPLCWYESGEVSILGFDVIVETTENIKKIRARILTTQSRQKSYADQRRKQLEFKVGEHVFLRVTPTTGIGRAIKTKKLNPRYIGPFEVLRRFGSVAYQVALPPYLSNLHDVFHVSQLRKYTSDVAHVLEPESVELKENLTFQVTPVRIDDSSMKKLQGKEVQLVKVVWERVGVEEHTWNWSSRCEKIIPNFSQNGGQQSRRAVARAQAVAVAMSPQGAAKPMWWPVSLVVPPAESTPQHAPFPNPARRRRESLGAEVAQYPVRQTPGAGGSGKGAAAEVKEGLAAATADDEG